MAKEISEVLWRAREPHAIVDLDELCRGVLPGDTETGFHIRLAAENLAAVWFSFRCRGARRRVVARIVESADDIAVVAAGGAGLRADDRPARAARVHAGAQRRRVIADLALEVITRLGWAAHARAASD